MGEEEKIIIEAKQGNATAQLLLGLMYSVGKGIPRDDEEAFYWLTESAEQGNAEAQLHLGFVYENGKGTPQDYEKALYWFTKSAEQGDAEAHLKSFDKIGVHYLNGKNARYAQKHLFQTDQQA